MFDEPVQGAGLLYGVYLLLTLGCTFYVIYEWKKKERLTKPWSKWNENWPKLFTVAIVIGLWLFQDHYNREMSYEASAYNTLNNLFNAWEAGDKEKVINFFIKYEGNEKPWNPEPEYDSGYNY